jgi:hypothetical protein
MPQPAVMLPDNWLHCGRFPSEVVVILAGKGISFGTDLGRKPMPSEDVEQERMDEGLVRDRSIRLFTFLKELTAPALRFYIFSQEDGWPTADWYVCLKP